MSLAPVQMLEHKTPYRLGRLLCFLTAPHFHSVAERNAIAQRHKVVINLLVERASSDQEFHGKYIEFNQSYFCRNIFGISDAAGWGGIKDGK